VFSGSVALSTSGSGVISIDGIQEITENLVAESVAEIVTLGSQDLRRIDGNLTLFNLSVLSTLSFPSLTAVNTIDLNAIPDVASFTFTSGLSSVSNVLIKNTFLSSLNGINLINADNVQIISNNHLADITLPLQTAKTGIQISGNGGSAGVNLPQLTSSGSIFLGNVSSVSMPSLSFLS